MHKCESLYYFIVLRVLVFCLCVCVCVRDFLQVSGREVNHKEMRMKTLFRLAPSASIKTSKISNIRWFIFNKFKHSIVGAGEFPGIMQSPVHEEVQLH